MKYLYRCILLIYRGSLSLLPFAFDSFNFLFLRELCVSFCSILQAVNPQHLKPRKIFIWLLILNNKLAILKFMLTVNFSQNLKRLFCYFLASFLAVGKINCCINCHSFVGYLSFLYGYF